MKEQNTGEYQDNQNLRLKFFWTGIIMAIKQEDIEKAEFELQRLEGLVAELETREPNRRQFFFNEHIARIASGIKTIRKEMQQTSRLSNLLEKCKQLGVKFQNARKEVIPHHEHGTAIIPEPHPEELKLIRDLVSAYAKEDPRSHMANGKLGQSKLQEEIIYIFGEIGKKYPGSERLADLEKAYHEAIHAHIIKLSQPYIRKKEAEIQRKKAEQKQTRKGKR